MRLVNKTALVNQNTEEKDFFYTIKNEIDSFEDKPYIDLSDNKELMSVIKRIESLVRKSLEYREYIKFLKDNLNLNKCIFFSNLPIDKTHRISIEMHHYPFTLFDITSIVLNKYNDSFKLDELLVANEIMELHYKNLIGLVPLTTTVHELAHNGDIFINLKHVYGNYTEFLNMYSDYINDELKDKLKEIEETSSIQKDFYEPSILSKNIRYIESENVKPLKKLNLLKFKENVI